MITINIEKHDTLAIGTGVKNTTKVYICDEIMGSGKTSAAITFMNEHPERRYIYITPYLEEAKRIVNGCKKQNFRMPSNGWDRNIYMSKTVSALDLIRAGENIASTHAAFSLYTNEMQEAIRSHGYTVIIDEAINILQTRKMEDDDCKLLLDAGFTRQVSPGLYTSTGRERHYSGKFIASDAKRLSKYDLVAVSEALGDGGAYLDEHGKQLYFWQLRPSLFRCFDTVIIMTYLFDAQQMRPYLDMMGFNVRRIGIRRDVDGSYHFSSEREYLPPYLGHLSEMIEIYEGKYNAIGNGNYALTQADYNGMPDARLKNVKNALHQYLMYECHRKRGVPTDQFMWTTFKDQRWAMRGKGYASRFLVFNLRASNDYAKCRALAYMTNVYMTPPLKAYLNSTGAGITDDEYALSTMVQWIWRSAIRTGEKIYIFVPSERMRRLLTGWIASVEKMYTAFISHTA